MRAVSIVLMLLLVTVGFAQASSAITVYNRPSYFSTSGQIKLLSYAESNNSIKFVSTGDEPNVVIGTWWYEYSSSTRYWCQGVSGLRGYAPDFPRITLKINKLYTAWFTYNLNDTSVTHYSNLPIVVLGHENDNKVLTVRVLGEINPIDNTWHFGLRLGIYNIETNEWEQYTEIYDVNFTNFPITIDIIPEFYSITVENETTIVFGWRMRVYYNNTLFVYNYPEYILAYESIKASVPVNVTSVIDFVQKMRGWYIWVGGGLSLYVNDVSVRYCEVIPNNAEITDMNNLAVYHIVYPNVENWIVNTEELYNTFIAGGLENYTGPNIVYERIRSEQGWDKLYSGLIPWIFGLIVSGEVKRRTSTIAAAGLGVVLVSVIGLFFGWSTVTIIAGLLGVGAAVYILSHVRE